MSPNRLGAEEVHRQTRVVPHMRAWAEACGTGGRRDGRPEPQQRRRRVERHGRSPGQQALDAAGQLAVALARLVGMFNQLTVSGHLRRRSSTPAGQRLA